MKNPSRLRVYIGNQVPHSLDPLEYDSFAHHFAYTSVFSPLVSLYKKGEVDFVLADSITCETTCDSWLIKLRKDIKFQNGDLIDANVVALNLKRVAFIMKSQNSRSGLFEFLIDLNRLSSPENDFEGIKVIDSHQIKLTFLSQFQI